MMKRRPAVALVLLFSSIALGVALEAYDRAEQTGHPQTWVHVLGYVELALLALFVIVVLTGFFGLVRRTFHDTRRGSYR